MCTVSLLVPFCYGSLQPILVQFCFCLSRVDLPLLLVDLQVLRYDVILPRLIPDRLECGRQYDDECHDCNEKGDYVCIRRELFEEWIWPGTEGGIETFVITGDEIQ